MTKFSSSIVAIAPRAAAQAIGDPPNVPPRPLAWIESITSALPVTAASGRPPAIPLAVVIRSGTIDSSSQANIWPVLAKPVCTSSAIKRIPFSLQNLLRPGRNPLQGTIKPPSPRIGSITMQATFFAPISFSIL